MKLILLVLCIFTVSSYAATASLKLSLQTTQAEEEFLFFPLEDTPAEVIPGSEQPQDETVEVIVEPESDAEVTIVVEPQDETGADVTVVVEPTETAEAPVEVITETQPTEEVVVTEEPQVTYTEEPLVEEEPAIIISEPTVEETTTAEAPVEETIVVSDEPAIETTAETSPVEETIVVSEPAVEVTTTVEPVETTAETSPVEETIVVSEPAVEVTTTVEPVETTAEASPVEETIVISPYPETQEFPEQTGVPGGRTDVDLSTLSENQELQSMIDLGVETLLETTRDDGTLPRSETSFRVTRVNRIQQQVVAGMNYFFDVVLQNDEDIRIYATFTVFSQPWTQTLDVTQGCVKVGRVVRH